MSWKWMHICVFSISVQNKHPKLITAVAVFSRHSVIHDLHYNRQGSAETLFFALNLRVFFASLHEFSNKNYNRIHIFKQIWDF